MAFSASSTRVRVWRQGQKRHGRVGTECGDTRSDACIECTKGARRPFHCLAGSDSRTVRRKAPPPGAARLGRLCEISTHLAPPRSTAPHRPRAGLDVSGAPSALAVEDNRLSRLLLPNPSSSFPLTVVCASSVSCMIDTLSSRALACSSSLVIPYPITSAHVHDLGYL